MVDTDKKQKILCVTNHDQFVKLYGIESYLDDRFSIGLVSIIKEIKGEITKESVRDYLENNGAKYGAFLVHQDYREIALIAKTIFPNQKVFTFTSRMYGQDYAQQARGIASKISGSELFCCRMPEPKEI